MMKEANWIIQHSTAQQKWIVQHYLGLDSLWFLNLDDKEIANLVKEEDLNITSVLLAEIHLDLVVGDDKEGAKKDLAEKKAALNNTTDALMQLISARVAREGDDVDIKACERLCMMIAEDRFNNIAPAKKKRNKQNRATVNEDEKDENDEEDEKDEDNEEVEVADAQGDGSVANRAINQ